MANDFDNATIYITVLIQIIRNNAKSDCHMFMKLVVILHKAVCKSDYLFASPDCTHAVILARSAKRCEQRFFSYA